MTTKMSPFLRNVQTVAAILVHAAGEDFVPYSVVASNVEAEIRAKTFGGNDLAPEELIEGVIMSVTSRLINSGILECNSHHKTRSRISYGKDTAVRLSSATTAVLEMEASRRADPNEHYPYFGTDEADTLIDRLGNLHFTILNAHVTTRGHDRLAFMFGGDVTSDNIAAAKELTTLFHQDTDFRRGIVSRCFSDEAVHLEIGDADLGFKDHDGALS